MINLIATLPNKEFTLFLPSVFIFLNLLIYLVVGMAQVHLLTLTHI